VSNYDLRVSDAKRAVISCVCRLNDPKDHNAVPHMESAVDDLNAAWDALTDALVRQRDELGEQVLRLINELAEAKKGKS
jgi:hypothetical protein